MTNTTKLLHYKIEATPSGFIGQCVEIPAVIAFANTKPELKKEMKW